MSRDTASTPCSPGAAVPGNPSQIVSGDEGTWILDPVNGTVTEVDPGASRLAQSWPVGEGAVDFAVGKGSVWVARQDGNLLRIDPLTGESTTIDIGTELAAVAVDPDPGGLVWVLTFRQNR